MRPSLLVLMALSLAACQRSAPETWLPRTAEVTTASDRALIASYIDELQEFARRVGDEHDFRKVPVRVVDEFSYSFSDNEVGGVCYPGDQPFIELKRTIFVDEEETWNILVHELGHCVLGRSHDDAIMASRNRDAMIRRGARVYPADDLRVSVMSSRGNRMAPRSYYLRELFGMARIENLRDLARTYPFSIYYSR